MLLLCKIIIYLLFSVFPKKILIINNVNSLMEHTDLLSIDDQLVALSLHLAMEAAVGGVVLEHVDLLRNKRVRWRGELFRLFTEMVTPDKSKRDEQRDDTTWKVESQHRVT